MSSAAARSESEGRDVRRRARWRRVLGGLKIALPLLLVAAFVIRQRFVATTPMRVHALERGDVVREVFGRGTLESRREVQLGFDLVGRISDILVDEGDRVKLGQVLAHLAPEQFSADVRTATSAVSLAGAALARLDADEKRASANLEFAESESTRIHALARTGSVSTRDVDLVDQQLALARAELDRVRATRAEAHRQIAVASGTVETRNVTAARAVLVSPFDGVVVRRLRDPGDTVTVGTTVLRVVAVDALWSRAWIDEAALTSLQEGQRVRVRLGADGPATSTGKVDRIGREADRQTHEILVDVLLDEVPRRIAIGQRADVWIAVESHRDVPRIPLSFVLRDEGQTYALVDRDGRARRVALKAGLSGVDFVEVSGLGAADRVLAPLGIAPVADGQRWRAEEP